MPAPKLVQIKVRVETRDLLKALTLTKQGRVSIDFVINTLIAERK